MDAQGFGEGIAKVFWGLVIAAVLPWILMFGYIIYHYVDISVHLR